MSRLCVFMRHPICFIQPMDHRTRCSRRVLVRRGAWLVRYLAGEPRSHDPSNPWNERWLVRAMRDQVLTLTSSACVNYEQVHHLHVSIEQPKSIEPVARL